MKQVMVSANKRSLEIIQNTDELASLINRFAKLYAPVTVIRGSVVDGNDINLLNDATHMNEETYVFNQMFNEDPNYLNVGILLRMQVYCTVCRSAAKYSLAERERAFAIFQNMAKSYIDHLMKFNL